jgi:hypothetical protein
MTSIPAWLWSSCKIIRLPRFFCSWTAAWWKAVFSNIFSTVCLGMSTTTCTSRGLRSFGRLRRINVNCNHSSDVVTLNNSRKISITIFACFELDGHMDMPYWRRTGPDPAVLDGQGSHGEFAFRISHFMTSNGSWLPRLFGPVLSPWKIGFDTFGKKNYHDSDHSPGNWNISGAPQVWGIASCGHPIMRHEHHQKAHIEFEWFAWMAMMISLCASSRRCCNHDVDDHSLKFHVTQNGPVLDLPLSRQRNAMADSRITKYLGKRNALRIKMEFRT